MVYNSDPILNTFPLVQAEYQSMVCSEPVNAATVSTPAPHLKALFASGARGIAFITAVATDLVKDSHPVVLILDAT